MYVRDRKKKGILLNEERKNLYYTTERNKEARYQWTYDSDTVGKASSLAERFRSTNPPPPGPPNDRELCLDVIPPYNGFASQ